MIEQLFCIVGDARVIHRYLALLDHRARAPAATVDHLLVRQNGLVDRVPIYRASLFVDDAFLQHLQEHPLIPFVIVGAAGGHFARPVDRQTHCLHLLLHVIDVCVSPLRRGDVVGHRGIFGGHAKCIPAHRHEYVVAAHTQLARHHIIDRVITHVAHM